MHEHEIERQPVMRRRPEAPSVRHRDDGRSLQALAAGRRGAADKGAVFRLQRAVGNSGMTALLGDDEPSPVHDVVGRGGGQPLDTATRSFMEPRLGADLSAVRVHTDGAASESAKSVQAHAYTVGSDVVFQSGKYDPGSDAGKRMLAHELTHVVQQSHGPVDGTPAAGGISVSDPSDRFEQEAERTADRVVSEPAPAPSPSQATSPVPPAPVQRAEEDAEDPALQGLFVQREEEEVPEEPPVEEEPEEAM